MIHDCEQCPDPSACREDDNGECCQTAMTDKAALAKIKAAWEYACNSPYEQDGLRYLLRVVEEVFG